MSSLPPVGQASFSARPAREPDAHGQAALLLVESLLHVLGEKRLLSNAEAVDAVECACGVKREVAEVTAETGATMQASLDVLHRMARSLRTDSD